MLGYKDIHINTWAWQFTEYLKFNKRFQSPLKFELDNWKSPLLTLELQKCAKNDPPVLASTTALTEIQLNPRSENPGPNSEVRKLRFKDTFKIL